MTQDLTAYSFDVAWSEDDQEYVGLCAQFPSLSWLAATQQEAGGGIRALVADVLADFQKTGPC